MSYQSRTKPYAHQVLAGSAAKTSPPGWREYFAQFMEMGTGKTKVDIDESGEMFLAGTIDLWIILAPKGAYLNWLAEIEMHMGIMVLDDALVVEWRTGKGNATHAGLLDRLCDVPQGSLKSKKYRILVMNIEALSTASQGRDYLDSLVKTVKIGMKVTVDESTFIKSRSASRTEQAVQLGQKAKYRRILTGWPGDPIELYSQLEFLTPRPLGFSSFYSYRARYAVVKRTDFGGTRKRPVDLIVGFKNLDDLQQKLKTVSFRVRKEDCLDLPPKVYESRDIELTPEQSRIYADLKKKATAELDGEAHVTATMVLTRMLRLHQVVCGHVTDELGVRHDIPSNRVQGVLDTLADFEGKAIIWSKFRPDIEKIVAAIGKAYGPRSVVQYHGGTNAADRKSGVERFQNGDARFMVSNQQTGGFGNTWTAATLCIYYSNGGLEGRLQSEDRPHRAGQRNKVTYVDLIARGTVDEHYVKLLRKGLDIESAVVGDDYKKWLI